MSGDATEVETAFIRVGTERVGQRLAERWTPLAPNGLNINSDSGQQ